MPATRRTVASGSTARPVHRGGSERAVSSNIDLGPRLRPTAVEALKSHTGSSRSAAVPRGSFRHSRRRSAPSAPLAFTVRHKGRCACVLSRQGKSSSYLYKILILIRNLRRSDAESQSRADTQARAELTNRRPGIADRTAVVFKLHARDPIEQEVRVYARSDGIEPFTEWLRGSAMGPPATPSATASPDFVSEPSAMRSRGRGRAGASHPLRPGLPHLLSVGKGMRS
jgi:hypothetical protein